MRLNILCLLLLVFCSPIFAGEQPPLTLADGPKVAMETYNSLLEWKTKSLQDPAFVQFLGEHLPAFLLKFDAASQNVLRLAQPMGNPEIPADTPLWVFYATSSLTDLRDLTGEISVRFPKKMSLRVNAVQQAAERSWLDLGTIVQVFEGQIRTMSENTIKLSICKGKMPGCLLITTDTYADVTVDDKKYEIRWPNFFLYVGELKHGKHTLAFESEMFCPMNREVEINSDYQLKQFDLRMLAIGRSRSLGCEKESD